jgi:hypothetical protein
MNTLRQTAAGIGLGLVLVSTPAFAACFEDVGCTDNHFMSVSQLRKLSCDALWTVRNTIYDENGYCFHTARAKSVFSNAGCSYNNGAAIPFDKYERTNIQRVLSVEHSKGC